jgi:two-component system sensor histidine kinase QseC
MMLRTIQARLMTLGLAVVVVVGVVTGWMGYRRAVHEVDELVDAQLAQYARVMLALTYIGSDEQVELPVIKGHAYQSRLLFQLWEKESEKPRLILSSVGAPQAWPPDVMRDGYSIARIGGRSWRCFAARDEDKEHTIWTGLDLSVRDELARDIAFNNLKPYAFGLPILAFLLIVTIQRGLIPLRRMDAELGNRSPERLDPLSENEAPSELLPLIRTMNNLFGRVSRTLDNERRFTSDAAHELRTPLAALRMQLQVAQRTQDEGEKQAAVAKALRGAERMTHLVGQLLALARLESANATGCADVFDLSALTEDAIRELAPAAADKPCRLEHDIAPELMIHGNPDLLAVLLRNLLDNALRYSATGGRIEVRLMHEAGSNVLRVADDGSGVAVEDREKLGARFQRFSSQAVEGVGLGLSIVRRVAELHGASVAFSDGLDDRGLCVEVRFPDAG